MPGHRHRRLPALLGGAALAAAAIPLVAATAAPGGSYPDLVADPPTAPYLDASDGLAPGRLLLRFDGFVHNRGAGPLEIRGSANVNGVMTTVQQRVYTGATPGSPSFTDVTSPARVIFEANDQHNHWHLRAAARYSLVSQDRGTLVAPAMKAGFCLEDSETIEAGTGTPRYYQDFCRVGQPAAPSVFMGIQPGWRDVYYSRLAFQWVDVSQVAPGSYWIRSEADPDGVIAEGGDAAEDNTPGYTAVTLPGWLARPAGATSGGGAVSVTLAADAVGSPGARRFRIESAPAHGTLSAPVGGIVTGTQVTYTPDPGYGGADAFTYSAQGAVGGGWFPVQPPAATATLQVAGNGAPVSVALSGAPSQLYAGTGAQLAATILNGAQGITWRVLGAGGETAGVGTIGADGRYTAPDAPPPSGAVVVRATSTADPTRFAEARIAVLAAPAPVPAPLPAAAVPGPSAAAGMPVVTARDVAAALVGTPSVGRRGRLVVARARPTVSGRLTVTAIQGSARLLARRRVAVGAGALASVRLRLPSGAGLHGIRVAIVLDLTGQRPVTVRAALRG